MNATNTELVTTEELFATYLRLAIDAFDKDHSIIRFGVYYGKSERIYEEKGFKWYMSLPDTYRELSQKADEIFDTLTGDESED